MWCERGSEMGADDASIAVLMQPGAQIDIGSLKLSEQCSPPQFKMIQSAGIHPVWPSPMDVWMSE